MSSFFVLAIISVFILIFVAESEPGTRRGQFFQSGLIHWLITGNWTAKVGAGLLILGIGALLRYVLKEVDIPDLMKLSGGIVISAGLALAAYLLKNRPDRKGVYFALAGASAGVAYLSAYAAYGFFDYIQGFNALLLLGLVALAAGIFAVNSKSLSIAILSMTGAYLAPAFSLENTSPLTVYGYYILISSLCLIMVSIRGWRGLIHLSFIFTLAGSVFFAWTSQFYQPMYYSVMQPILLALAAIHLAMPLLERQAQSTTWLERFDTAYFIALPSVCALLTWSIAPYSRQVSIGFALLALIWAIAALTLKKIGRADFIRYGVISALLFFGSAFFLFDDIPWYLFTMAVCVALLAASTNLGISKSKQELLAGILLFTGFLHAADTLFSKSEAAFFNQVFLERTIASLMLGLGAVAARKREIPLWQTLATFSVSWMFISFIAEIFKLNIDYIPQLVHALAIVLLLLAAVISKRFKTPALPAMLLVVFLIICCWWASLDATTTYALFSAIISPVTLMYFAYARLDGKRINDQAVILILSALPLAISPWIYSASNHTFNQPVFIALTAATLTVICVWKIALHWQPDNPKTDGFLLPFHFFILLIILIFTDLFHIVRSAPAVVFELLTLYYLIAFSFKPDSSGNPRRNSYGIVSVFAATLVIQAMILRLLGPHSGQVLTIADLDEMNLPVIISLTWALLGAGLTWWSSVRHSRTTWLFGTGILAVSAFKMAVFDFGSLDQLGNIFALIAAGIVFLLVAWFAPFPPKPSDSDEAKERVPDGKSSTSNTFDSNDSTSVLAKQENAALYSSKHENVVEPAYTAPTKSSYESSSPIDSTTSVDDDKSEATIQSASEEDSDAIRERVKLASRLRKSDAWAKTEKQSKTDENDSGKLLIIIISLLILISIIAIVKLQIDAKRINLATATANATAPAIPAAETSIPDNTGQNSTNSLAVTASKTDIVDSCSRFGGRLILPSDFKVFAAGGYNGVPAGFQIDQSGHEATTMDVKVNYPDSPVILMLAAYEPTVWTISASVHTEIIGVLLSGRHSQAIAGIKDGIPILNSTIENQGVCGGFLVSSEELNTLNSVSQRAFGHSVDAVFSANNGNILIGKELLNRSDYVIPDIRPKDAYVDADAPLAGTQGILKSINDGLIRRASDYDRKILFAAFNDQNLQLRGDLFVVQKEFTYPSGLYGAHSVSFMIPDGVPEPLGDPGHSLVYHMDSKTCTTMNNMRCMH